MDDPELQGAMDEIDAYDAYNTKRAEVEANAAADDAPVPTEVSLDDVAPVPDQVDLNTAVDEAADKKEKVKAHKNALDELVRQSVHRMAKEMGVDYEDLFAASGGPTPDEVEPAAEKKAEAKDPKAEQKEAVHKAPAPVRRQEQVQPGGRRDVEDFHQQYQTQAKHNATPAPKAPEKKETPKEAPKSEHKPAPAQPKAEDSSPETPALHRSESAQRLKNEAEAAAMRGRANPENREQYRMDAVRASDMKDPNRDKMIFHDAPKPVAPTMGAPRREVDPVIEQMHRNGQINDHDYQRMVEAIKGH